MVSLWVFVRCEILSFFEHSFLAMIEFMILNPHLYNSNTG